MVEDRSIVAPSAGTRWSYSERLYCMFVGSDDDDFAVVARVFGLFTALSLFSGESDRGLKRSDDQDFSSEESAIDQ